jgi:UPF0716 protein FxsA
MVLVAGAVLITPGFLTDVLGFSLLLPPVRRYLGPKFMKWFAPKPGGASGFHFHSNFHGHSADSQPGSQSQLPPGDFFDMPEDEDHPGIDGK